MSYLVHINNQLWPEGFTMNQKDTLGKFKDLEVTSQEVEIKSSPMLSIMLSRSTLIQLPR